METTRTGYIGFRVSFRHQDPSKVPWGYTGIRSNLLPEEEHSAVYGFINKDSMTIKLKWLL